MYSKPFTGSFENKFCIFTKAKEKMETFLSGLFLFFQITLILTLLVTIKSFHSWTKL